MSTPRTDAQLSGIDSFGNIPSMEERFQRMCRHVCQLEIALSTAEAVIANLKSIEFDAKDYCPVCSGWEVTKGQGCQQKVHTKNCWLHKAIEAAASQVKKQTLTSTDSPIACPECFSDQINRHQHAGNFSVPECTYLQCEICHFQWGHE